MTGLSRNIPIIFFSTMIKPLLKQLNDSISQDQGQL